MAKLSEVLLTYYNFIILDHYQVQVDINAIQSVYYHYLTPSPMRDCFVPLIPQKCKMDWEKRKKKANGIKVGMQMSGKGQKNE